MSMENEKGGDSHDSEMEAPVKSNDLAQKILRQHAGEALPTPEECRQTLWKIDLFLMPMMIAIYALQYLVSLFRV